MPRKSVDESFFDDDERFASIGEADTVANLLVEPSGRCWICDTRPATTGEHKFKASNLMRLMGSDGLLIWGDGRDRREIRGKSGVTRDRYGVVKWPKSLCAPCNNHRSQSMDRAYDEYSKYVESTMVRIMPGLNLHEIFGSDWQVKAIDLGRYFAKHFGCRMVRDGCPIPASLRAFVNGSSDMPDARLSVISTDTIHRRYGKGESLSKTMTWANPERTRITGYVIAAYVRSIGVRYEWRSDGFSEEDGRSNFFDVPYPPINFFKTDYDMIMGQPRKLRLFARVMRRLVS